MALAMSTRRGAGLYLLVWLMLGLLFAVLMAVASGALWSHAILFAVPATLVYGVASGFSAYYLCRAYPLAERKAAAVVAVLSLSALISGGLWALFCMAWDGLWRALASDWSGPALTPALRALIVGLGVVLYGLSAVGHYLAIEFERSRSAERREFQAALMAQEAELRMLRTQIDPHFLFNSLNSISALTSIDAARARAMTVQLADFFRHSLGMEAHRQVTLSDEITLVRHFLAIEQVRFGARLRVTEAIDDLARACLLPPMLLQPLVENAVKHGVGNLTEGGSVDISARRAGSLLHISVDNDVDPDMPAANPRGIGLANVRQRLAAAYGHHASVHWARSGARFRVALTLPATTMEQ